MWIILGHPTEPSARAMSRRQKHKKLVLLVYGKGRYVGNPNIEFYTGWVICDLSGDCYDFLHADDGGSSQPDISRNVHASHIVVFSEKDKLQLQQKSSR